MYRAVCICPRMRKWDSRGYSRLPRTDSSRGRSTFGSRVVFRGSRTFCRLSSTESNGRESHPAPLTASPLPTGPGGSHEDRRSLITLSCITQKIGSHYSSVRHEALVALRGPSQHAARKCRSDSEPKRERVWYSSSALSMRPRLGILLQPPSPRPFSTTVAQLMYGER